MSYYGLALTNCRTLFNNMMHRNNNQGLFQSNTRFAAKLNAKYIN